MVDHLTDYKKMGDPFQGIDDGLGGKILPSLPLSGKKNPRDQGLSDAISGVADNWAKLDISGQKLIYSRQLHSSCASLLPCAGITAIARGEHGGWLHPELAPTPPRQLKKLGMLPSKSADLWLSLFL
jgi:hypothetical protein